jgi:AAA domain
VAKKTSSRTDVASRVEAKIKRASELKSHERFLIYAISGAGKTRLSATLPNPLIIDVNEKGTGSTRRDLDPHVYPVDFWQEINEIYWYLQSGNHDFESWALDGATAMQTLCLNFVLGDEASRDASRDPDMPSRQVWGKVGQLMKTQITNFRNLPMNGCFTALTRSTQSGEEDEDMGEVTIGPAVSPSVAGHLEAAVDTIGYLFTREVVVKRKNGEKRKVTRRRLLTGSSAKYVTKDRNGLFGEYVDSPDLSKMLEVIANGGQQEALDG